MLIVQKFGGSSVANAERVVNVAKRIADTYKQGNEVVVVLSAQGDTTDDLIAKAKEISPSPNKRELDMLLSTGEQQSVALMCMALVGMITTSVYGNARLKKIKSDRIRRELDLKNIVVVTGFQGINRFDDMTTLGRGGSDTTAVAIAAALHADCCEIYTDVDGIYTADPRIVKHARKLSEITYDEMLELASLGAKVLHNRSVEMAKKYNVELVVRSSLTHAEGTVVKEVCKVERMLISGVAGDDEIARVSLIGIDDTPGKAFDIFATLAKKGINVDIIVQSIGREKTKDISFTIAENELADTRAVIEAHVERWGVEKVDYNENLAKVSIVGAGMTSNPGIAAKMFEAMFSSNINIHMISTSEIKVSILIDKKDMHKAINAIHDIFNLEE